MYERLRSKSVSICFQGLVERVDQHLLNALVESENPTSILDKVFEEYSHELRRSGQIPAQFEEDVFEELRELTLEVIRKRTYGCLTIQDFKKKKA